MRELSHEVRLKEFTNGQPAAIQRPESDLDAGTCAKYALHEMLLLRYMNFVTRPKVVPPVCRGIG